MQEDKKEEIPLSKLLEAITPYQAGIYVTVLNIIQCITLAFLINEVKEASIKGELSLILIMRSAVALIIILVIWHRYVCESQYLWPMSWWDTIIPFSMGIGECAVVFSINEKVSLVWFLRFIALISFCGAVAYGHACFKRKMEITRKLYRSVYLDCPSFAFYLLKFLVEYDERNLLRFFAIFFLSLVFIFAVWAHHFYFFELVFPAFYLFALLRWEALDSFHRAMMSDVSLRSYF